MLNSYWWSHLIGSALPTFLCLLFSLSHEQRNARERIHSPSLSPASSLPSLSFPILLLELTFQSIALTTLFSSSYPSLRGSHCLCDMLFALLHKKLHNKSWACTSGCITCCSHTHKHSTSKPSEKCHALLQLSAPARFLALQVNLSLPPLLDKLPFTF